MKIFVTGTAGFIGFHIVRKLVKTENIQIIGIDNLNEYYDINLKHNRLRETGIINPSDKKQTSILYPNYKFLRLDIADYGKLNQLFEEEKFDYVIHMAAQAGVRYSIENPQSYVHSNLVGFTNILECCRYNHIKHLIYASSSSVYGMKNKIPFSETDNVDYPVSMYAATKKSNELLAHSYSHLYNLPTTGLRFFTVYGPWGRPDMAPMIFADAIWNEKPIKVFNNGNMQRDFTYIDDIVKGVMGTIQYIPDNNSKHPYYRIFNIGNSRPVQLLDFIAVMEESIGKKALLMFEPMQPGDVKETYADTSLLEKHIHYKPQVSIEEGISKFTEWYRSYYHY